MNYKDNTDKLYRLTFPYQNRQATYLLCGESRMKYLFKRKNGHAFEFRKRGNLTKVVDCLEKNGLNHPVFVSVDIREKYIDLNTHKKFTDIYKMIEEEYQFFKSLKNEVIKPGWFDAYLIENPELLHDKKIDLPESLERTIENIANFNVEDLIKPVRRN
ncbi:hypothetical protein KY321_01755 [Candidatus Woesearchaeota archaeon]|nr:hypothetical protein [Candidatus Woesearchaeota archaeon]